MLTHGFELNITPESVDVCRDPAKHTSNKRFYGGLFILVTLLVFIGVFFFDTTGGKSGLWKDLQRSPVDPVSVGFAIFFVLLLALMCWWSIRYMFAAWPSDESLHCERSTITISSVRWFDRHDNWVTNTYPLSEVSDLRYGVIASTRGTTIYGLRYRLGGKKQKLLAGLEAPEAAILLKALKSLGADVPDDPKLQKRITAALEMRGQDTSWMDRSWMDHT